MSSTYDWVQSSKHIDLPAGDYLVKIVFLTTQRADMELDCLRLNGFWVTPAKATSWGQVKSAFLKR